MSIRSLDAAVDTPPPHHLTDWGTWNWVIALVGVVVLYTGALIAMKVFADRAPYDRWGYYSHDSAGVGTVGTITVVAAIAGGMLHWYVARHIDTPTSDRMWLILPFVVAGFYVYFATESGSYKAFGYAMAGLVAVGGVVTVANDVLSRIASSIPMTLSTLVLGIVGLLIIGGIFAYSDSR